MLSPRHRAKRNARLGRRFRVANLITNVDRLWCRDGAPTQCLAQFGGFAKHGHAASEARDQSCMIRTQDSFDVFA